MMTTDERWIREKTVNPKMCEKCGGRCCKQCGCSYFPEDFPDLSFEAIYRKISLNEVTIDTLYFLESLYNPLDEPVYYLRVANKKGGGCIFLTDTGCKFSYEERPAGGRLLVPFWSGCYYLYSEKEFIEKWMPYQKLLKDLINAFSY